MTTPPLKKLPIHTKIRSLPGKTWNELCHAAERAGLNNNLHGVTAGTFASPVKQATCIVKCQNTTGENLDAGDVVQLVTAQIDINDEENDQHKSINHIPVFSTRIFDYDPDHSHHQLAICMEPIVSGQFGVAAVPNCVWAKVHILDNDHHGATPWEDHRVLSSGSAGLFKILWKPAIPEPDPPDPFVPETKLCLISLASPTRGKSGFVDGILDGDLSAGLHTSMTVYKDGDATGETISVWLPWIFDVEDQVIPAGTRVSAMWSDDENRWHCKFAACRPAS